MKNSNWVNRARKWMSWFGVLRVRLEKDLRRFDILYWRYRDWIVLVGFDDGIVV